MHVRDENIVLKGIQANFDSSVLIIEEEDIKKINNRHFKYFNCITNRHIYKNNDMIDEWNVRCV